MERGKQWKNLVAVAQSSSISRKYVMSTPLSEALTYFSLYLDWLWNIWRAWGNGTQVCLLDYRWLRTCHRCCFASCVSQRVCLMTSLSSAEPRPSSHISTSVSKSQKIWSYRRVAYIGSRTAICCFGWENSSSRKITRAHCTRIRSETSLITCIKHSFNDIPYFSIIKSSIWVGRTS